MNVDLKLKEVEKEYAYYKIDYERKMYENIVDSIKYCLNIFCELLTRKGYVIETNDLVCKGLSVDIQLSFKPKYDYKKNPRQVRIIEIIKEDMKQNKRIEYNIGIFSDAPLPKGNLNRLFTNPTKGMSNKEIELLEKQKSIKYFKEYILEKELAKYWVYQALNVSGKQEFGYEKDILKHYERIV